ncbi:MAG TPA: hypothetical protein VF623_03920 [Segetibacter sp.]|jgi:hypothetical protein
MTLYDFLQLPDRRQIATIYKDGVFIGKCCYQQQIVAAYQVHSFYVEIFYRKYRYYISDLHCFTSVDLLAPYLSQIDIKDYLSV